MLSLSAHSKPRGNITVLFMWKVLNVPCASQLFHVWLDTFTIKTWRRLTARPLRISFRSYHHLSRYRCVCAMCSVCLCSKNMSTLCRLNGMLFCPVAIWDTFPPQPLIYIFGKEKISPYHAELRVFRLNEMTSNLCRWKYRIVPKESL